MKLVSKACTSLSLVIKSILISNHLSFEDINNLVHSGHNIVLNNFCL